MLLVVPVHESVENSLMEPDGVADEDGELDAVPELEAEPEADPDAEPLGVALGNKYV